MRQSSGIQTMEGQVAAAYEARRRAAEALVRLQRPEGFWWAVLTGGDTTLESDFILLQLWLHPPADGVWNPSNRTRIERAVPSILERQLPDGGFSIYPKGPADVSASVIAYFALKLAGIPQDDPRLKRCREKILSLGGIQSCNRYVKINLSLFGLYPREYCPAVPPEIMLPPGNLIYQISSWTRAIVIPLSILHSSGVTRPAPHGFTLQELYRPDLPLTYKRMACP
jgi:squalene-hopene/tetraprenyl-beta-curcumene cyclase